MYEKKIGILSNYFCAWPGGTDLIRYLLNNLISANTKNEYEFYLIVPRKNIKSTLKKFLYPIFFAFKKIIRFQKIEFKKWPLEIGAKFLDEYFSSNKFKNKVSILYADYSNQSKKIIKNKIDIVLPCVKTEKNTFLWIGYLFDFQHEYLPQFFSKDEIEIRKKTMKEILFNCKHVFTNSKKTKNDAKKFYGKFPAEIHTIPYAPCIDPELTDNNEDVIKDFNLNKNYFIICNQFWKHKNHETAIKAFADYIKKNGDADLVLTGNTNDKRFPEHFNDLKKLISDLNLNNKVKILGLVRKKTQIALVRNARALIQPTLFEGGPGGGSCRDAVSLDTEIFASDIEINKEINCGNIKFFEALNFKSLSNLLINSDKDRPDKKNFEILTQEGESRKRNSGDFLLNIIDKAINEKFIN